MGVIDTLNAGFRLVFRRPWLALIPFLLDMALWRAPKLSMSVLIERLVTWLNNWTASLAASQVTSESLTETVTLLRETVAAINVFGYVAWDSLGVPSIAASMPIRDGDAVIQITQVWQLALIAAAVLAIGLVFAALYLVLIGTSLKGKALSLGELAQSVATAWARLGLISLAIGAAIISASIGTALLGPFAAFLFIGLVWMLLYLSFFPQAVTLGGFKPLAAAVVSIHVVRTSLWPTLGLLLLVNLLDAGLSLVWQQLATVVPMGMIVAIILSSLIGTGLTAALFYFYSDRSSRLVRIQMPREA